MATNLERRQALGINQPTLSRLLASLFKAGLMQKFGAAPSPRYALARSIAGLGSALAVMRVDAEGQPHRSAAGCCWRPGLSGSM